MTVSVCSYIVFHCQFSVQLMKPCCWSSVKLGWFAAALGALYRVVHGCTGFSAWNSLTYIIIYLGVTSSHMHTHTHHHHHHHCLAPSPPPPLPPPPHTHILTAPLHTLTHHTQFLIFCLIWQLGLVSTVTLIVNIKNSLHQMVTLTSTIWNKRWSIILWTPLRNGHILLRDSSLGC